MRLPYLQLQQSAWLRAKMLATLLGIHRQHALGLMADLWLWALELAPEDAPVTGEVEDSDDFPMLCTAVEWKKSGRALADALEKAGVIELQPHGFRVRGAHCYTTVVSTRKADRERKRKATEVQRSGPAPDAGPPEDSGRIPAGIQAEAGRIPGGLREESGRLPPVNATQTQRNASNSPSGSAAAPPLPPEESAFELLDDATTEPPAAPEKPPVELPPARKGARQKPPDPLHAEAVELLTASFAAATGERYGFLAKDAAHVKTLLGLCARDLVELDRRWRFALLPPEGFWPGDVRDLGGLVLHWNKFVARKEPATDRAGLSRPPPATEACPACGDSYGERFGVWGTRLCRACIALLEVDVPSPSAAAVSAWVSAQKGAAA